MVFLPLLFYISPMAMAHSCHIVKDSITLLTCSFSALHISSRLPLGLCNISENFSINAGSNSSHHHSCFNYDINMNTLTQELHPSTGTNTLSWWWPSTIHWPLLFLPQPLYIFFLWMLIQNNLQNNWDYGAWCVVFIAQEDAMKTVKCLIRVWSELSSRKALNNVRAWSSRW